MMSRPGVGVENGPGCLELKSAAIRALPAFIRARAPAGVPGASRSRALEAEHRLPQATVARLDTGFHRGGNAVETRGPPPHGGAGCHGR